MYRNPLAGHWLEPRLLKGGNYSFSNLRLVQLNGSCRGMHADLILAPKWIRFHSKSSCDIRVRFSRCYSSKNFNLAIVLVPGMSRRRSIVDIESADSDCPLLNNDYDVRSVQLSTNLIHDFSTILFSTYINVLLIFLPFAILSDAFNWSSAVIFALNFLALIPLALLLSFTTKELTKRVGSTAGGLLNITFGNATELIVGIVALRNDQINLIQTSMLGSILSTLLFVFTIFLLVFTN